MKQMNVNDLNKLYQEADSVDKKAFSEMRSNVLLASGEHYTRSVNKQFDRLRKLNKISESQKLRLTKNHTFRITKTYENSIIDKAPGIKVLPKNETELQDRKAAEQNDAVWQDQVERNKLKDKTNDLANHFVVIGECAIKIFWDKSKGDFVGYNQKIDDLGQPLFNELGQPEADKNSPVFSGDVNYKTLFGFNIFRCPSASSMHDSPYIGHREMISKEVLKRRYAGDKEKLKAIETSGEKDFVIFDSSQSSFSKEKDSVLIKEVYYKPSIVYPLGYFYIWTTAGILEEGELPEGLFPIVWEGFEKHPTSPRAKSIIKVIRPYQAEINRAASQMATHQITTGDDKILYQAGTKLSQGSLLPGVRGIAYNGAPPTVLAGRTGDQFSKYIFEQIDEMYKAALLDKIELKTQGGNDAYGMLYRSMSQQAVFKPYVERFSHFLVQMAEITLRTCKAYMDESRFVQVVGRSEQINVAEFKSSSPLNFQINVQPVSDSIDTMLGKQLTMQHIMQYVGKNLGKDEIGKMIKNMPFMNHEESFGDLTLEYENVSNDMLALERGEVVQPSQYADTIYYIKKLTNRIKKSDFKVLDPGVQQNYMQLLQAYQDQEAMNQQKILAAKNEFIPIDGPLITVDFYVTDPNSPTGATKRAKLPQRAIEYLMKRLDEQGASLDKLEQMNEGNLSQIAEKMIPNNPMPPQGVV